MGFLSFFLGEKKSSASVAKERLQLILAHERSGRSRGPDYLADLLNAIIVAYTQELDKRDKGRRDVLVAELEKQKAKSENNETAILE